MKAKRPGSRVGEDGTGMGERERHQQRERERTEDNMSVGPSPPPLPELHLLGAAKHPLPRGSGVMARGVRDQTPVLREPSPGQILSPGMPSRKHTSQQHQAFLPFSCTHLVYTFVSS